jgi:hypothetical protein
MLGGGREAGQGSSQFHCLSAAPPYSNSSLSSLLAGGELTGGIGGDTGAAGGEEGHDSVCCDGVAEG